MSEIDRKLYEAAERLVTTVGNIRDGIQPGDVYIGRPGRGLPGSFGNPFTAQRHGRERAIDLFRTYFHNRLKRDPVFRREVHGLRGRRLVCFCSPLACHGDVIAEYLNAEFP